MDGSKSSIEEISVALRKESVDRNGCFGLAGTYSADVALRKESVDRNVNQEKNARKAVVALRKESVDRNNDILRYLFNGRRRSPQGERG